MKACKYCGRESEDTATACAGCGTLYEVEEPAGAAAPNRGRSFDTPIGRAAACVLASVLICTGVAFASNQVVFDLYELSNGGPIGKPGIYAVGIVSAVLVTPILLGLLIFTFVMCQARSQTPLQGLASAVVAVAIMCAIVVIKPLRLLLPVVLMGTLTPSSIDWYLGAAMQIAIGAWLFARIARLQPDRP